MDEMVHTLINQKSRLSSQKIHIQQDLADINAKIERLKSALGELEKEISNLQDKAKPILSFEIDSSKWKGEKKGKFEEAYDVYKKSINNYLKKAENKKEQLSDEIRREESKRSMYQDSLSSIAAQISNVSSLIETAQF
ncbi:YwqH-like family protein [Heyndrickxia faecalis]|uniref:YwqH-like family protein n=1 Tax=Heyndrickxia faecalis TaxID=2824910 RepID=UPI003D22DC99